MIKIIKDLKIIFTNFFKLHYYTLSLSEYLFSSLDEIFISIKINLDYTNIFLGVVSCISTYEIINYQQKIFKLEKYNFDLKEKTLV